ncbi:MAG: hypothetical protein Q8L27_04695 [archaeon]|nr:hypothetical protein [archaeon]
MADKKLLDMNYPYIRLKYSWDLMFSIEDFINCIKSHKTELRSPRNIGLMNFMKDFYGNKEFNPAGVLKDYIYLEANSFFEYAKLLKSKGDKNMPDLPNYLEELKNFRNVMVGHRDKKELINFPQGWIELQEKTAKLIPIRQLLKDVDTYYQEVMKRHSANSLAENKEKKVKIEIKNYSLLSSYSSESLHSSQIPSSEVV